MNFYFAVLFLFNAQAADLDLTITSSTGCDEQWSSDCISNNVWGAADSLAITTCDSADVLYMSGVPNQPAGVGFVKEPIGSATSLHASVTGDAASTSTKVGVQVRYFNANNTLVGSDSVTLHTGKAGVFGGAAELTNIPSTATTFSSRLVVSEANATIWSFGCNSGEPNCSVTCYDNDGNTYSIEGWWEGGLCTAMCPADGYCDPDTWPVVL